MGWRRNDRYVLHTPGTPIDGIGRGSLHTQHGQHTYSGRVAFGRQGDSTVNRKLRSLVENRGVNRSRLALASLRVLADAKSGDNQSCVLEVAAGERRGKGWIDHRTPFGAIGLPVKTGYFSRARPDLDLPSQRILMLSCSSVRAC